MITPLNTSELLQKVSVRLEKLKSEVQHSTIYYGLMAGIKEEQLAYHTYLNNSIQSLAEAPNERSILFGTVHFALLFAGGCSYDMPDKSTNAVVDDEIRWPFKEQYKSNVLVYDFFDHRLEVSVLEDHYAFYITFNLPENVFFYDVVVLAKHEFSVIKITADLNTKQKYIGDTSGAVLRGLERMQIFIATNKKPRKRYGEQQCLEPFFRKPISEAKSPSKKRRFGTTTGAYSQLQNLITSKNKASSGGIVLMSIFRTVLKDVCGYTIVDSDENDWPTTSLTFYSSNCTEVDQKVFPCTLSVLENGREFYVVFRFTLISSVCIRKVLSILLPSLEKKDLMKDVDRIWNLTSFIRQINDNFIKTVMVKEPTAGLTTPIFRGSASASSSSIGSSFTSPR